ncbi:acetyl/propionyl/methylcrotonyl-CoA carboxylase subunit alpha [Granulosicoccus antarcticus]|uniref:Biotin carboxylase n=1 Tax=Granulosicoccus antarcticus IMCC3135 TaxID=1192854 RepID=A0A2Z2NU94_9GAMM|nr:biotin carboxylase N-terminal domain-containing protein [Granulosicoccus antarcticus]ASJ72330.1 Acetyl-/propionyl-coenzyme A carboxylase alpha chain [Granulosicoccus antarcticus IMCC3135]
MRSLLIANRGEIACRIIRTAKRRGLRTIAVYSDVDAGAQHVLQADVAVCIGAAAAASSYLDISRIIAAAKATSADAIHPGYGFLSENPALVDACVEAGIIFVGPDSQAMRAMGLKDAAKRLMQEAGVPVVPGYHGESQEDGLLLHEAQSIGYPVLIKARAGGGGKGMRRVNAPEDFPAALAAAQREAQASFGDAHVLIEKYVAAPRHIEVQVFGDSHGNVVHLFERDCSLQRRHQKVIEEAPAPGMSTAVRAAMTDAAVKAARAINYQGAGTVEFIVDGSQGLRPDGFWFMEMNTRLQVEHPVTEAITGVDLVDWQLRVAAGEALPLQQSELQINGHAVEARLYAENPATGFLPAVGELARFQLSDIGRTDSGVVEGDVVLPYYDPLLAKLITHADSRTTAFNALARQLADSVVLGAVTNREFLWQLVSHPQVLDGHFDTSFIESHLADLLYSEQSYGLLAVAAASLVAAMGEVAPIADSGSVARKLGSWQIWGAARRQVRIELPEGFLSGAPDSFLTVELQALAGLHGSDGWCVRCPELEGFPESGITVMPAGAGRIRVDECDYRLDLHRQGAELSVQLGPCAAQFTVVVPGLAGASGPAGDTITSPMPGRVVGVNCVSGEVVKAGQSLIIVEAMKMEQELCCERDGVVDTISVRVDQQVAQGMELLRLKPVDA